MRPSCCTARRLKRTASSAIGTRARSPPSTTSAGCCRTRATSPRPSRCFARRWRGSARLVWRPASKHAHRHRQPRRAAGGQGRLRCRRTAASRGAGGAARDPGQPASKHAHIHRQPRRRLTVAARGAGGAARDPRQSAPGHAHVHQQTRLAAVHAKGDLAAAETLLRGVVEGRGETLGSRHPNTLRSIDNLNMLLKKKSTGSQCMIL